MATKINKETYNKLEKLIEELLGNKITTSDKLRKSLPFFKKFNQNIDWSYKELNGYHGSDNIPQYRIIDIYPSNSKGEEKKEIPLLWSVSEIESVLKRSKENQFLKPLGIALTPKLNVKISDRDYEIYEQTLNTVLRNINNKLYDLLTDLQLEIENIIPNSNLDSSKNNELLGFSNLKNLEDVLIFNVYDYVLKNPVDTDKSRHIPPNIRKEVFKRDKFQCQICLNFFKEEVLQIDHIFPFSYGGSKKIMNLMALCIDCNRDKGNRLDYYQSDEGRSKILYNIEIFVRSLELITNFGSWLKRKTT